MNAVNAALEADGVSAPGADVAALKQVVADARAEGIDLKIVVIPTTRPSTRPCATSPPRSGKLHPDLTVLAISPWFAGTYSRQFDRVTLEAGQDVAKTGNPVQSSKNFVGELTTSHFRGRHSRSSSYSALRWPPSVPACCRFGPDGRSPPRCPRHLAD